MSRLFATSAMRPRIVAVVGAIALIAAVAGCSSGSPTGATAPASTTATSGSPGPATSGSSGPTASGSAAPASSEALPPAAGGGATDFCSAFEEYRAATQEDTPEAEGAGYRAAATDVRTFAPADIKVSAGLLADVMDEVGQSILAGNPAPELLSQGQSSDRQKALFDVSKWIDKNCP